MFFFSSPLSSFFLFARLVFMSYLTPESIVFTQIYEGKTQEVIAAIENGVIPVDCRYFASSGDTPLFWTAVLGNVELARFLISKGANVNFQQARYLATPLHAAARRGLEDMCLLLLDSGADTTLREKNGKTAGEWLSSSRCKAVHTLSEKVKERIGFKPETGAYAEPEVDLKFWGKYGPPAKMTKEEEEKAKQEEKEMFKALTGKKK